MSTEPTPEQIRQSIVPKSDQLNADDLLTGPLVVKVSAVKSGNSEQPISIELDGHKPYKPCKSMRRVLIAAWGDDGRAWKGRSMTLFCDPEVKWAGVKVGGIRISHLSHIENDMVLMLTTTRGKRQEYQIKRLSFRQLDEMFVDDLKSLIAGESWGEVRRVVGSIAPELKNEVWSQLSEHEKACVKTAMTKQAETT